MSKTKLYKLDNQNSNPLLRIIVGIIVYALVLMLADYLFEGIYIDNYTSALVAALILSVLNYSIKPILIFLTLPLTIVTYGILYPIVNMIILKICDIIMGSHFVLNGYLSLFFIAIFISLMKIFLDSIITKKVGR